MQPKYICTYCGKEFDDERACHEHGFLCMIAEDVVCVTFDFSSKEITLTPFRTKLAAPVSPKDVCTTVSQDGEDAIMYVLCKPDDLAAAVSALANAVVEEVNKRMYALRTIKDNILASETMLMATLNNTKKEENKQ